MMKRASHNTRKTKKSAVSMKSRGFVHSKEKHFNQDEWNEELSDYLQSDEYLRDVKLFEGEQL